MSYNVGGVQLERPFKIRRLGHFGVNLYNVLEGRDFYVKLLGFRVSDRLPFAEILPAEKKHIAEGPTGVGYFLRYGSDHHSLVIFPKHVRDQMGGHATNPPEVTVNQITWQVGSLQEVVDGTQYFREERQRIIRAGRDMPGSNWHVYLPDYDGHTNELYYGIEQVGWDGFAKPRNMHARGFHEEPELPQISEQQEVDNAYAQGVRVEDGYRWVDEFEETFVVDGVLMPRPFKIVGEGPVRLFTPNVDDLVDYYERILGLTITEEISYAGRRVVFLRCNADHHIMALYDIALRAELGLREDTTLMSFGMKIANYRQLRDAAEYLRKHGCELVDLPGELFPGIEHAVHVKDPDGHIIQLYVGMEQIGWNGLPNKDRPVCVSSDPALWPEAIEPSPATFGGEVFLGPWQ